jgi:putative acetyltransferase
MIEIIDFEDNYAKDFRSLNLAWLDQYGLTEPRDWEMVNDPRKTILDLGGSIFLARSAGKIVGTAALIKINRHEYELAKMAVDPFFQGKGIGRLLLEQCKARAQAEGAKGLFLYSNSKLLAALHLYRKQGFEVVPLENSPFLTADVKMEIKF